MRKTFLFVSVVTTILTYLVLYLSISKAVYFATDYVSIYENENKINNDSVLYVTSSKTHSEICAEGVCLIGQQLYPVTFYKAKNTSALLTFAEFSLQNPYQGGEDDGLAKDSWHNQTKESYLSYLDENSDYATTFEPGPSGGGEGCGYPGCLGGRVGDDRLYSLNIVSGEYQETANDLINERSAFPSRHIMISLAAITLILIIFFIKKRNRFL